MKEQTARFDGLLLVSDIDGTLTELTEIPQANIRAIHEFIEQGGVFTLCTGRPRCALRPILRQLEVNAPVITINGGCIYDTHTGEILSEALLCLCPARPLPTDWCDARRAGQLLGHPLGG